MSDTQPNPPTETEKVETPPTEAPTVAESEAATEASQESTPQAKPRRKRNASAQKGSSWERRVGRDLSNWLTYGERANIFTRNVMSGGQWTAADKRGAETNLPGDIAAAHPLAFDFLKHFSVEVKHNQRLVLSEYLLSKTGRDFIAVAIQKVIVQSERAGLYWMFIGRQNRRPPFIIMNDLAGDAVDACNDDPTLTHRLFGNARHLMMNFEDFLKLDPQGFMNVISHKRTPAPAPPPRRRLVEPTPIARREPPMPRRELRV